MMKWIAVIAVFGGAEVLAQPCQPQWGPAPAPAGKNGAVNALLGFDDGSGPALFVAGGFTAIDGVPASKIARWDGAVWEQVGDGLGEEVLALAAFDHGDGARLYAAGMYYLIDQSTLAEWDGQSWRAVPETPNVWIGGLGVSSIGGRPELYISGPVFDYVRRWDGSSWRSVGDGLFGVWSDLAEIDLGDGPAIYVGGGIAGVYGFDGTEWSVLGNEFGFNHIITALEVFDDGRGESLFVGGHFTAVDWQSALRVVRRAGGAWEQVGDGFDGAVNALALFDDGKGAALYAAGEFTHSGAALVGRIARWDGAAWQALGSGLDGPATVLAAFDVPGGRPALIAAGEFTTAGGEASPGLAAWLGCECRADFNGDGVVNTVDVLAFLNAWAGGEESGDFNGDGVIDTRDVLAFLNAWSAGC